MKKNLEPSTDSESVFLGGDKSELSREKLKESFVGQDPSLLKKELIKEGNDMIDRMELLLSNLKKIQDLDKPK